MRQEDLHTFAGAVRDLFIAKGKEQTMTEEKLRVWYEDLSAYPIDVVTEALRNYRSHEDEWPSTGKVVAICRVIHRDRMLEDNSRRHIAYLEDMSDGSKPIPPERLADLLRDIGKSLAEKAKK